MLRTRRVYQIVLLLFLTSASVVFAQSAKSDLALRLDRLGWASPPEGIEASARISSNGGHRDVTLRARKGSGTVLTDARDNTKAAHGAKGSWIQNATTLKRVPGHASDPLAYPEDIYYFRTLAVAATGADITVENLGVDKVDSVSVTKFRITRNANGTTATVAFSESSGFPVQVVAQRRSMSNWHVQTEVMVTYSDFRIVGKTQIPHMLKRTMLGRTDHVEFNSVVGSDVPDSDLKAPSEGSTR